MKDETRPVLKYKYDTDSHGLIILKPVYLTETPQAEIDRLNKLFPVPKQGKGDKHG